jgi:hypothetical protein
MGDITRLLHSRHEAASQLSISVRSLDYLIARKQLDTRRIGRKVLIPHTSLVRFAGRNHYEGVGPTIRSDADAVTSGERCA